MVVQSTRIPCPLMAFSQAVLCLSTTVTLASSRLGCLWDWIHAWTGWHSTIQYFTSGFSDPIVPARHTVSGSPGPCPTKCITLMTLPALKCASQHLANCLTCHLSHFLRSLSLIRWGACSPLSHPFSPCHKHHLAREDVRFPNHPLSGVRCGLQTFYDR